MGPPLTENNILDIESEIGLNLPYDYKEFLLACNGGVPSESACVFRFLHPIRNTKDEITCITDWCSIGGELDLFKAISYNRDLNEKMLFPIGQVTGGHILLLSAMNRNENGVYLNIDDYSVLLSDSFGKFYQNLLPYSYFENDSLA